MAAPGVIGLDVGSSSVRAAEMSLSKHGELTLERFGQLGLPLGAVRAGIAMEPAAVTRAVKELWKDTGFRGRRVNVSVNSGQAAVRSITLPPLAAVEMRKALPFLVRDVIPIPIDRAVLDFIPVGEVDSTGKQPGLLVALPSDGVAGIVRAVEKAGLNVVAVDFGPFAALRSLIQGEAGVGTFAVIDVGATLTTVVVQSDGIPLMVRVVSRGGDEISEILSERLGISRAEAETQKRNFGFDESFGPVVAEVVRAAVGPLLSEIRSSLAYFSSSNPELRIERIDMTGGGSLLSGLRESLTRQQDVPVDFGHPFTALALAPAVGDPALFSALSASAIGLTLGGSNDKSPHPRSRKIASPGSKEHVDIGTGKPAAGVDPSVEGGPKN